MGEAKVEKGGRELLLFIICPFVLVDFFNSLYACITLIKIKTGHTGLGNIPGVLLTCFK